MHPKQLHFVAINSYLSPWHRLVVTPLRTRLCLFGCLLFLVGTSLAAQHARNLTVIWSNAASSSACLHDVSLTATTLATPLPLVPKVIQQIDSLQPEYQRYKDDSASFCEKQWGKRNRYLVSGVQF